MDIIVTIPKSEMKTAAAEAAKCLAEGGGWRDPKPKAKT